MGDHKKILLSLPDSLVESLDRLAKREHTSRADLIRNGLSRFAREEEQKELYEQMRAGYQEMGEINLSLAEGALFADTEQIVNYEERLSECE